MIRTMREILTILEHPHPCLRTVCAPAKGEVNGLIRGMFDAMYRAPGRGLAAPQVGEPIRLFVMDPSWRDGLPDPRVFVNPEIVARQGHQVNEEACLSIPGTTRRLERARRVVLAYDGRNGRRQESFEGFVAAIVQHEVDHLDGVLILDHPQAA
ncbi:peptide deformylase [Jannaschia aquimarina]|nr:peptide deformylase [Jannaschia aquimarina]